MGADVPLALAQESGSVKIEPVAATGGFRLVAARFLPHPRARVFEFFSDAFQLEALTPQWLHFSVLTPPPIRMAAGTVIDYWLRVHGVPIRWQSRIKEWEPPGQFVDEQTRGPYRRWHHRHVFEAVEGGTLCRDIVDYAVYGGWPINALFVRRDLLKIFAFRQNKLREIFSADGHFVPASSP
jgi:ligand-binding SRPBCC domain-containing protein